MTELEQALAATRAMYQRLQDANQCLVNVHRLLSPPLPQRMKKLNLIRCIEAARLEIEAYNAQMPDHAGAGDSEHEAPAPLPGKVSRNDMRGNINRTIIMRGRGVR